jgi:hypothetical protein
VDAVGAFEAEGLEGVGDDVGGVGGERADLGEGPFVEAQAAGASRMLSSRRSLRMRSLSEGSLGSKSSLR